MALRILIVDDHPMVLAGMEAMLKTLPGIGEVHSAKDAPDAIHFLKENRVDLVLSDIHLPEISGIELCLKIKKEFPDVKVVGMSTFTDKMLIQKMMANGATGFISKSASLEEIGQVLDAAGKNQVLIKADGIELDNKDYGSEILVTRREKEMLLYIAQGLTTKEIADKSFVSINTVETHRKNLLEKFGVLNTASLISMAAKMGLV